MVSPIYFGVNIKHVAVSYHLRMWVALHQGSFIPRSPSELWSECLLKVWAGPKHQPAALTHGWLISLSCTYFNIWEKVHVWGGIIPLRDFTSIVMKHLFAVKTEIDPKHMSSLETHSAADMLLLWQQRWVCMGCNNTLTLAPTQHEETWWLVCCYKGMTVAPAGLEVTLLCIVVIVREGTLHKTQQADQNAAACCTVCFESFERSYMY